MPGFVFRTKLLSLEAIFKAIELNGVAIETNQKAFQWGQLAKLRRLQAFRAAPEQMKAASAA